MPEELLCEEIGGVLACLITNRKANRAYLRECRSDG
jgi:hypothetical protein